MLRLAILVLFLSSGLSFAQEDSTTPPSHWLRLVDWMDGSFSSQEQASADSNYFDIRLHMVRLWPEVSSAIYLYVEQARADKMDTPYRQRVYRITQVDDTTLQSEVFTLPDPLRFAGAWKAMDPTDSLSPYGRLSRLRPDSLIPREGCAIILYPSGDTAFVGSTVGKKCSSDLRGAAYATSEVIIGKDYLYSWDRGFDSDGNQVWGATGGGYWFRKEK